VRRYIPRSVWKMKAGIHPEYYETDIVCACARVSHPLTRRDIKSVFVRLSSLFTGEQKFVDTRRVEKFARRYGSTKAPAEKKA